MVPLAGASPEFTHKEGKAIIQVASLFNQLLQHFPRMEFGALVKENNAERCAKGFGCWTQLVAMLFCQLAHAGRFLARDLQWPELLSGQTGSSRHNQGSQ